jgi:GalNAc-alpha-(1->4)-GalNAc-alpha-(1->3)-diNAcBac-PP-undecaprenol alpha-1,4-N-acetyl-D-galactosaminyltransferase
MNVLLAIPTLGAGGAERVMTHLADWLVRRGCRVTLVTLTDGSDDFFVPASGIRRVGLGLSAVSRSPIAAVSANATRVRALRRVVRDTAPDAVISFLTEMNALVLVACAGLRIPVMVSERVDPREYRPARQWRVLRRLLYPHAAALVVQTHAVADWYRRRLGDSTRVVVIPNPVLAPPDEGIAASLPAEFLLGAGRLVPQKGFDVLVHAFASVASRHPSLHLVVAGDGPERARLREMASSLGVGGRVHLPGKSSVGGLMRRCRAFVLASRFEGFPNVLLEAMACGAPVVATDCPSGPREILEGRLAAWLVPVDDADALARTIDRVLDDSGESTRGADAASVVARHSPDAIGGRWWRLLAGELS